MLDGANAAPRPRPQDKDVYNTFGQLGLADVLYFLRRHFLLLMATTSAAIAVALVHVFTAVPLFTANGQLLIDVKVPHLANEQWRETGMVLDSAQVESQIAVLRSENIARAVVRRLDLLNDPEFIAPEIASAAKSGSLSVPDAGKQYASHQAGASKVSASLPATVPAEPSPELLRKVAGQIHGRLGIRRVGYSYVLEISYTSPDAEKAARIANAIMQSYIDDQVALRVEAARQGSEWLERRINTLRLQMNAAALKVQEFKARRDYSIAGRAASAEHPADGAPAAPAETLDEIEATAMTYRRMFESALQAYTEVEQHQSYPVSNARIISPANPPLTKSSPKRKQALAIGTVAGLVFGFGLALMLEGLAHARAKRSGEPATS